MNRQKGDHMNNTTLPTFELPRNLTAGALSTVNFMADLAEYIMTKAGSQQLRGGTVPHVGTYIIEAGNARFGGRTKEEAFRALFHWLVTAENKYSMVSVMEAAQLRLDLEHEETEMLLDVLAEGGMSEFGKQVQDYRSSRGSVILTALQKMQSQGNLPKKADQLLEKVKEATGIADLDLIDILPALQDLNSTPPTA